MAKSKPRKPPKKSKPEKPKHRLRCGLVFRPGPPWKIDVTNFADFRDAIGDPLLVAFSRAFNLSYKLASIVDLMKMNLDVAHEDETRLDRNLHTLGLFACGVARELPDVITELRRADIERHLSAAGQERWTALQGFERFENHKLIKLIRDELAFHAGSQATIQRGINHTAKQKHQLVHVLQGDVLVENGVEKSRRNQVRADMGLGMLFAGLQIETKELERAYTEIRDIHFIALRTVYELFYDVMYAKGADLPRLEPATSTGR